MQTTIAVPPSVAPASALDQFRTFQENGGKFRVAVTQACNLDCFFCHNEGMRNPRRPRAGGFPKARPLSLTDLSEIAAAYAALGGRQVNVTGGEPLLVRGIVDWIGGLDVGAARVVLNTNAVLAERLLAIPKIPRLDELLISLHTTDEQAFRERLGGTSLVELRDNIVSLAKHGYAITLNYSLGGYNAEAFGGVLDFAVANGLDLKAIALVRSSSDEDYYAGAWIDPAWLDEAIAARGAQWVGRRQSLGGTISEYRANDIRLLVKNVAAGRLHTELCNGCDRQSQCGEGIYGLRVGVDGFWKPCLLQRKHYAPVDPDQPYAGQILDQVSRMVGDWQQARFVGGSPE